MNNVAVLITCYNRKDKTLRCLDALFSNALPSSASIQVFLVDDGSTDGTAQLVRENYPSVEIIAGDGNLFWNRGMHLAFSRAASIGFDAYLWLNDDTFLFGAAIDHLINTYFELSARCGPEVVVVGATRDAEGRLSYGGSVPVGWLKKFQYRKVWDAHKSVECHVMNGNCVLIPSAVVLSVGNLDPHFEHAMGDIDYALRVRALGGRIFVAPGYLGECSNNPVTETFMDKDLALRERWNHITSRKGLPVGSWYRFTRRHGGLLWPLYFLWPYLKTITR